jgi:hypothetical protein
MKKTILLAASLASACAVQHPQNAEEFRQRIPGAFMGQVKTFEVKRPLRDVARTFQKKGPECLNVAVRMTEHGHGSASNVLTTYKPTVLVNDRKAELHVQRTMKGNVITPGTIPDGGMYFLVADATPIDKGRTKIDIYGPSRGADALTKAVTAWATGESLGCPDMTKN